MSDDRNQGGGLAVIVVCGILFAVLALCGGGGVYYLRHVRRLQIMEAVRAEQEALAAKQRARLALEQAEATRRAAESQSPLP